MSVYSNQVPSEQVTSAVQSNKDIQIEQAYQFLSILDANNDQNFTFQTFDDDQTRKSPKLAKILHGSLREHEGKLRELSAQGAGIFVTVNETDLKGRMAKNVSKVRSAFVDLDGAPLDPVLEFRLSPSMIIESSPNRWHAYWLSHMQTDQFTQLQKDLASAFDGDPSVNDLSRVMRLPGFPHQKVKSGERINPFTVQIYDHSTDRRIYTLEELRSELEGLATNQSLAEDREGTYPDQDSVAIREKDIREALKYLDPEPRDLWVRVGHWLKSDDLNNLPLYLDWSRGALTDKTPSTYDGDVDVIRSWNSYEPNRTSIAALFAEAEKRGYHASKSDLYLRSGSHVDIAQYLKQQFINQDGVEPIFTEGDLWRYTGNHWELINEMELRQEIHKLEGARFGNKGKLKVMKSLIDGVINELAAMCYEPEFFANSRIGVNCENGFVSISPQGEIRLEPHQPEHAQRDHSIHRWNPHCSELPPKLRDMFSVCFEENANEFSKTILEFIGLALTGSHHLMRQPKALIFYGASGANGKSTLQEVIEGIMPVGSVSHISPESFSNEQYVVGLIGKKMNLSDEVPKDKQLQSDRFKALITGDPVMGKRIYRNPFAFRSKAMHVLATNSRPNFSHIDEGLMRRLLIIPFLHSIPVNKRIPDMARRILSAEGSIIFSLAIQAAATAIERKTLSIPKVSEEENQKLRRIDNLVTKWVEDGGLGCVDGWETPVRELYKQFVDDVSEDEGQPVPSRREFGRQLRNYISESPDWFTVRRSHGEVICAMSDAF